MIKVMLPVSVGRVLFKLSIGGAKKVEHDIDMRRKTIS